MSYERLGVGSTSLDDNAIIVSIQCLAEQHAREMEVFELKKM